MFLRVNDRLVNLSKVSNIKVIEPSNNRLGKIFFNLDYSVKVGNYNDEWVCDYVEYIRQEDDNMISTIELNDYINQNFFKVDNYYINKNTISSVKFEDANNKICINFGNPSTIRTQGGNIVTSYFVFINSNSIEEYNKKCRIFNNAL